MSLTKVKSIRILAVAVLILLISALHYRQEGDVVHLIYRELYFLPIFLAGFWFGLRGGLAAAIAIVVLYAPVVIERMGGQTVRDLENVLEVIFFIVLGTLVGWLRDREKSHQEMRRREEGLAAMGRAVAFIAHDMQTPLVAMGGLCRQVRRKLAPEDMTAKKLDIVIQQTHRLESMIRDMLVFARPLDLDRREGEMNALLQEILPVAEEKAETHDVRLKVVLADDQVRFSFDSDRLQQALLNLINNAVEASSEKDTVTIRAGIKSGSLVVEVEDKGPGIAEGEADNIFQPFVTYKKGGTGLGLTICKKIAEAHGGQLEYEQQEGGGTIFRLVLPKNKGGTHGL